MYDLIDTRCFRWERSSTSAAFPSVSIFGTGSNSTSRRANTMVVWAVCVTSPVRSIEASRSTFSRCIIIDLPFRQVSSCNRHRCKNSRQFHHHPNENVDFVQLTFPFSIRPTCPAVSIAVSTDRSVHARTHRFSLSKGLKRDSSADDRSTERYHVDDRVYLSKNRRGTIKYIGPTSLGSGLWYGIELDSPNGFHDGFLSHDGQRYFQCKSQHGVFVRNQNLRRSVTRKSLEHRIERDDHRR